MTSADLLILALAVLNVVGIPLSAWQQYRHRRRWLPFIKERAALEVFLRDEFQCDVHFRHDGQTLHMDVRRAERPRDPDTPFMVH